MPAAIAVPLIVSAVGAGASVAASKVQSNAAKNAAKTGAAAATSAAQIGSETADKQLAYEQQQAALQQANSEVNRKANYDQYAASQRSKNVLLGRLGFQGNEIPDYVPGVNQSGSLGTPGTLGTPSQTSGQSAPVDGSAQSIAGYFASRGTTPRPTTVDYFVGKWPELVARGQELGDPNYAMKRLANAEEFGGGGATARPVAQQAMPDPAGIQAAPIAASPIYQRKNPYLAGTIGGLQFRG